LREYRFRFLLVLLVVLLLVHPAFTMHEEWHGYAFAILFGAVLLACTAAASVNRKQMAAALLVGIPTFLLHWIAAGTKIETLYWLITVGYLLVAAHTIATVLWYVTRARDVTTDTIAGAVSVYLLLGLAWAFIFALIDQLSPGAFEGIQPAAGNFTEYLYFSYTTLTTVGYGEVVPVNGYARAFANMEAVMGVLFLGAFIARIISLYQHLHPPRLD
jgi:voltage-gated potassium channel Kch